jgi:1,4-dihydroxy-2-naphthoyl-CoA hydrolase
MNAPTRAPIWHGEPDLGAVRKQSAGTLSDHLGITLDELGADFVRASLPVTPRVLQPFGLLHGGASMVLAETLGSIGATLTVDITKFLCVGQEINANHLRGAREGDVITGIARPVHLGRTSQVWSIEMRDARQRLVCISRFTVAVVPRPAAAASAQGSGTARSTG